MPSERGAVLTADELKYLRLGHANCHGFCTICAFITMLDQRAAEVRALRERNRLYNEVVTILLECGHFGIAIAFDADENTCGCRDRAYEQLAKIRALASPDQP